MRRRPPRSPLFPSTTLFRSARVSARDALDPWTARVAELGAALVEARRSVLALLAPAFEAAAGELRLEGATLRYEGTAVSAEEDRKSTRLNSSHANISYAVFC